ncbi:MAG: Cell division transporter, ATP-binding protein FtsE [Anaerolineae bacterium]|nr:MAG: Cell division transporter, ATP-binding protein FtsE [Anaerolineae bacterium]
MSLNNSALIEIRNLVKAFPTSVGDITVLKGINAKFHRGEFVGVIGKSGSGKTTLVNMIAGIDRPTQGEIFVDNVAVHNLSENELAIWRGKTIGIVFQFFQLLPMLSLIENVMLPMDFCNMYTPQQRKERAMYLLNLVEMADHADKLPSAISGGQQQRVAIARAMANDPPILLADEPTGNLDSHSAKIVFDMFEQLVREGKTVVMVTHDISQARRVDRTLLIADGEIVNEYVAKAIPQLEHHLMLEATRNLEEIHYEAGTTILREGEIAEKFFIITKGTVEVVLNIPDGSEIIVTELKAGQYFGEIELLQGCLNRATLRAASNTDVNVVALSKSLFDQILSQSETARAAITDLANERLTENTKARERA